MHATGNARSRPNHKIPYQSGRCACTIQLAAPRCKRLRHVENPHAGPRSAQRVSCHQPPQGLPRAVFSECAGASELCLLDGSDESPWPCLAEASAVELGQVAQAWLQDHFLSLVAVAWAGTRSRLTDSPPLEGPLFGFLACTAYFGSGSKRLVGERQLAGIEPSTPAFRR